MLFMVGRDTYRFRFSALTWRLHNIAIANIVWHILQYRVVDGKHILRNSACDEGGR